MKTTFQPHVLIKTLFVLMVISFFSCKDSDDPDPRQAFLGTYEMDDLDVTLSATTSSNDTTVSISNDSEIEFEMDGDLDADELKAELEEFVEQVTKHSLEALSTAAYTASADFDDDVIVEISGAEFELDDHDFDLTLSSGGTTKVFPTTISGAGELDGDEMTFQFEINISISGNTLTLEGAVEGEKD